MKKPTKDVYEIITEQVIKGLEDKGLNWFKPWSAEGCSGVAIAHSSGKAYRGINQLMLGNAVCSYNYQSAEFITFKQATKVGGKIKKGCTSHIVVFWAISYSILDANGKVKYFKKLNDIPVAQRDKAKKHMSPRYYRVFNLDNIEGVEDKWSVEESVKGTIFEPIADADAVYTNMPKKPTLKHFGGSAFYQPSTHSVTMPDQSSFVDPDSYYKVLFHELVHSTGHQDLLNRKTLTATSSFGSETYSQEELVAEMGCMFLVGILGLNPKDNTHNSQAYINGWISHLKSHKKELLYASAQSTKAVEYMLGC